MAIFLFGDPVPPPRAWLLGLAKNPQAPAPVVFRLLDHDDWKQSSELLSRRLPDEVVEAFMTHPEHRVRASFARRYRTSVEQQLRLAGDPAVRVRRALADRELGGLSDEVVEKLAKDPDDEVRWLLEIGHDLPGVGGERAWDELAEEDRERLLADPDPEVRSEAELAELGRRPVPAAVFDRIPDKFARMGVAQRRTLTRDLAERLTAHEEARVRRQVADNPHLPADLVRKLAGDEDADVRRAASVHPALSEEERAAIEVEFDPLVGYGLPTWVREREDDVRLMRECAASSNVLIRRAAACAKDLPPDVVERLAEDGDFAVRLLLAEHCRQAPASLLLFMWGNWTGLSRGRFRVHPNFPREGLARFADDPNPRMRDLVFLDDRAPPELIHRLSRDEDGEVRWRALHDERLSPERVVELLDDPDPDLNRGAAADPRLPLETLLGLLDDDRLAEPAASNPALPVQTMHQLLDRAGVA